MKKLLVVPVVAAMAAVSSASAAGFAGGVGANPLQTGRAVDLTCAQSATVVEYGFRDDLAEPTVDNVRIKLSGADCSGQAIHVIQQKVDGSQLHRAVAARIADQEPGDQYARVVFDPAIPAETLTNLRVSIDPGWTGLVNVASAS